MRTAEGRAQVVLIEAHLAERTVVETVRQFRVYERLVGAESRIEPSTRIRDVLPTVRDR